MYQSELGEASTLQDKYRRILNSRGEEEWYELTPTKTHHNTSSSSSMMSVEKDDSSDSSSTGRAGLPYYTTSPVWSPPTRVSVFTFRPRKKTWLVAFFICVILLIGTWQSRKRPLARRPSYLTQPHTAYNASFHPGFAFQPPEPVDYRYPDTIDTFASYKYRSTCNISSLDLHSAFSPLCNDRTSMVQAMSGGGRIGFDAPYMPRGCDMRWFSTEEVCEILGRFEKVIILGDSMMRHVIGSINVLIRKDLGYGAVTDWNFSPEERRDCFCNYQFNVKACSIQGIFKTADVVKNDPDSFACPANSIDVMIEQMIRFPIAPEELTRLRGLLPTKKPAKPYAFIFGHGLWNDLDLQATVDWLDAILDTIGDQAPWLTTESPANQVVSTGHHERKRETGFYPKLILTPNAAGKEKPDEWIQTQGNKALMVFEESVGVEAGKRGVEHLGTWNASIQANKFDGVHVDLKGNLIKAMMVLNWLNLLEVEKF